MTDTDKRNCAYCGRTLEGCIIYNGVSPAYSLSQDNPETGAYCNIQCWLIHRHKEAEKAKGTNDA